MENYKMSNTLKNYSLAFKLNILLNFTLSIVLYILNYDILLVIIIFSPTFLSLLFIGIYDLIKIQIPSKQVFQKIERKRKIIIIDLIIDFVFGGIILGFSSYYIINPFNIGSAFYFAIAFGLVFSFGNSLLRRYKLFENTGMRYNYRKIKDFLFNDKQ